MLVIMFPPLNPVALAVGPLVIRWYALAYLAGFLLGWRYALYLVQLRSFRPNKDDIDEFLSWAVLGVILGGRIGYVLVYQPQLYLNDPLEALKVWHGGMSFHGGCAGVILAMIGYAWRHKISFFALSDVIATVTPIGLFFGRLANFVNGELWGRVTTVPWGVIFPAERAGPLPRHPSQIYQALMEGLILFLILAWLNTRPNVRNRPGIIGGVFIGGYGLARVIGEFFREPDPQMGYFWGGITMGQILSIPMVLVGIALVAYAYLRKTPAVESAIDPAG
jgi:phosphatidylglycerol:prolipoprotein diacylglycerol transferase